MKRYPQAGRRHSLLLYRRVMDRLWVATLVLGTLLLALWFSAWWGFTPLLHGQDSNLLLAAGLLLWVFTLFAFFGRYVAYVQPRRDHLRLVTPFLRTNISYRRIQRVHPVDFNQLFPPSAASWSERRLLAPFYGKTAMVVELRDYPLPVGVLRLFLGRQMFDPTSKGLVFLVADWMAFSTDLDTFRGRWGQQARQRKQPPSVLQ